MPGIRLLGDFRQEKLMGHSQVAEFIMENVGAASDGGSYSFAVMA